MSRILEPRHVEPNAHKRWCRDGLRLLWRVSAGWMLVWVAFAVLCLIVAGSTPLFILMVAISAPAFDVHVLMMDRAATNRRGIVGAFQEVWQLLRSNGPLYLRSGLVRTAWAVATSLLMATLLAAIAHVTQAPPIQSQASTMPFWTTLFGIYWMNWGWVALLPALWQRGGLTSFRPWLVRRLGADEPTASQMQSLARYKNPRPMFSLLLHVTGVGCLAMIFAPIVMPIFDLYYAAVMRCVWHDLFDGDTQIQAEVELTSKRADGTIAAA